MKWPAMVRFDNSDQLELIESQHDWESYLLQTSHLDCQLILSDGTVIQATLDDHGSQPSEVQYKEIETISVDTAVEIARRHMAAQAHCCVSKFSAPSVAAVIDALLQLDD